MKRTYFSSEITAFLACDPDRVLSQLARGGVFPVEQSQRDAWLAQIAILK